MNDVAALSTLSANLRNIYYHTNSDGDQHRHTNGDKYADGNSNQYTIAHHDSNVNTDAGAGANPDGKTG